MYKTGYYKTVEGIKIPKVIDDEFVKKIMENPWSIEGMYGISSRDVSECDMSNLSYENFLRLSFDSNTIFSKEQIEKFHPDKLLKEKENYYGVMDNLHKAGINGEGVDVVIMDSPFDHTIKEYENIEYNDENTEHKDTSYFHGVAVLSAFLNIAPNANIRYTAFDSDGSKENDLKELDYLSSLEKNNTPDVISLSASIGASDRSISIAKIQEFSDKIVDKLRDKNCEFIDSPRFAKDFFPCNMYDGKVERQDQFEVTDETFEREKKRLTDILNDKEKIANYSKENINIIKEAIKDKKHYEDEARKYYDKKVKIVSGGITVRNDADNAKWYSSYSCNSFAIPQVSALYTLAKQLDRNISYVEFANIAKETVKENGVIDPEKMVRTINEKNREKAQKDDSYKEIYNSSSTLISNLDRIKEEQNMEKVK